MDRPALPERFARILPFAATLGAMACFQTGAAIAKSLYPAVGPQGAAALRLGLGAALLVILIRPWRSWPRPAPIAPLIGLGVAAGGAVLFFYMAIARLPLGVAISLQFLGPLSVAVVSSRRPTDLLWAALAAGGVWSLVGSGAQGSTIDLLGVASALCAAGCWAGYILSGRVASAAFGGSTAALATSIAALVVLPWGLLKAGPALFSPQVVPLALVVALVSTAIPFSLEIYALPRMPARTFSVFTSLEPAFGVISGVLLLGERLTLTQIGGVALVITAAAGSAWSSANGKARAPPPPT